MKKINSPKDLADFIRTHSFERVVKSLGIYDDSILINLYVMSPPRYKRAIYKETFARTTKDIVIEKVKRLYDRLSVPEINDKEEKELNIRVFLGKGI